MGEQLSPTLLMQRESGEKVETNIRESSLKASAPPPDPVSLQQPILLRNLEILHNHIQRCREGGREWERDGEGNATGRKVHTKK